MSERNESRGNVLILGAGFSRAINSCMPTANELGHRVYERLAKEDPSFARNLPPFSDDFPFETWLSVLAEEQPHLREAANRENAARFAKLTDAVGVVLAEAQEQVKEAPPWLYDLLSVLHQRQTTVITFNYDTLIEMGVAGCYLHPANTDSVHSPKLTYSEIGEGTSLAASSHGSQGITVEEILRDQPPVASSGVEVALGTPSTLRLLKLHGSLDWWWVPGDRTGATLVRQDAGRTFGAPLMLAEGERSLRFPGREPFIVPPLATKTSYYGNPVTRQLWQDAGKAMEVADRIALVGYSLPQADIVMSELLGSALRGREVHVDVVNLAPDGIRRRITALGGPDEMSGQLDAVGGELCVEEYVGTLKEEASEEVVRRVHEMKSITTTRDPVAVIWSRNGQPVSRRVETVERSPDGTVVLDMSDNMVFASGVRDGQPSAHDIATALDGAQRLIVRSVDGHEGVVVGHSAPRSADPNAVHMLTLIPAGQMQS